MEEGSKVDLQCDQERLLKEEMMQRKRGDATEMVPNHQKGQEYRKNVTLLVLVTFLSLGQNM